MDSVSSPRLLRGFAASVSVLSFICLGLAANAQSAETLQPSRSAPFLQDFDSTPGAIELALLPNAPVEAGTGFRTKLAAAPSSASPGRDAVSDGILPLAEASSTQKFIEAGQLVPALSAGDKVRLGLRSAFSPLSITGWFTSSGDEQLFNTAPNYGTDRGAFGQRLGAAALCNTSEGLLTDSIMAPLLHEDPRYYRLGSAHNFFARLVYAGTRPILTRTDSGRATPNFALVAGNLAGSALTNLYFPKVNRGPAETMETLGLSIGGSSISDVVGEFYGDIAHLFHRTPH